MRLCCKRSQKPRFQCLILGDGPTRMVRSRGIDLAWCVYDAQYFGTAQRRRRVFLVADFRGKCAGQILFIPKSLRGYFESGGTPRQALTSFAASSAGGTVPQDRYLSDTEVYCIVGNIIGRQPHNGGNGAGYQSDISYTLTGADRHAVVAPLVILNDQGGASMSVERSNISPTLRSQTHGKLAAPSAGKTGRKDRASGKDKEKAVPRR